MNPDFYIKIIEILCKVRYDKEFINDILFHSEMEGLCYVRNKVKKMVLQFELYL